MDVDQILQALELSRDPAALAGMARYGINTERAFGVGLEPLRSLARQLGVDQQLAEELWQAGSRETRLLAGLTADPAAITPDLALRWATECDSWDVCDGLCNNLLRRTSFAYQIAESWAGRPETFVKRAAFALMAALAVHDKRTGDERFLVFLKLVETQAGDERNYVRKGVSWALRQIGKRSAGLRRRALAAARRLARSRSKSARWVGQDALGDLA